MTKALLNPITDHNFDSVVLQSELPVFVCFVTQWCHTCYPACLLASKLARSYNGKVKFVQVDIETNPELADDYNIVAVPTLVLFRESQALKRLVGFQSLNTLGPLLDSAIAVESTPGI
ncbi:MAG: thioredoxin domain-containing protein [Dehalococcoidia bacterium]